MDYKGILLCGGKGTRLNPITKLSNKHFLPLYDKPLFFYPLSMLMLAGIRNILIIVSKEDLPRIKNFLKDGERLGIKVTYKIQKKPSGIPEALTLGSDFIGSSKIALILGDNFFYGQGLPIKLKKSMKENIGASIFAHPVTNANQYGLIEVNQKFKPKKIVEKPKKPKSNLAIPGIYFFNNDAKNIAKKLFPSKRGETEITDILKNYLKKNKLNVTYMGRGVAWLDAGTPERFMQASNFIYNTEKLQGFKIACLEEIALNNNWITKKTIQENIKFYGNCDYSIYLKKLI